MSGLIPITTGHSAPYAAKVNTYFVPSTDSTALFIGDPVALAGSGDAEGNYATVTRATLTANSPWVGVVVGVVPVNAKNRQAAPIEVPYRAASTDAYVLVADDPHQEFAIGEDEAGAAIEAADLGNLGLVVAGDGGSTIYGMSSMVLDSSSFDSSGTSNGQILLLGLVDRADFVLAGDGQMFRVRINPAQHSYG